MNTSLATIWQAVFLAGELALISPVRALGRLEPAEGCYLGFNPGDDDAIAQLGSRL